MAIEDRNLAAGTKLWAKYKGTTHTAEVVAVKALPHGLLPKDNPNGPEAEDDPRLVNLLIYKLSDGREYQSPSAAATAITGKAANGWAFWSAGEPSQAPAKTKPTVNAVPKPERKRRGRKAKSEEMTVEWVCGLCGHVAASSVDASDHFQDAHGEAAEA